MTANTAHPCPSCGTSASGNFCAACGAPLGEHPCASCGTILSAGAKFCPKCGTPAGVLARGDAGAPVSTAPSTPVVARAGHRPAGPTARAGQRRPWIVAGVFAIVAITAVVYAASRRAEVAAPVMANAGNAGAGVVVAPDISNMTPKEQFDRLVDRVTAAAERGDAATLASFWPMASGAYQNLPPTDRDIDARFHMGWLHLLAGQYPQAMALADTIMAAAPNHLLGYYLRASVAQAQGDSLRARAAGAAFRAHYDAEVAKTNRPEYAEYRAMLEKFRAGATAP